MIIIVILVILKTWLVVINTTTSLVSHPVWPQTDLVACTMWDSVINMLVKPYQTHMTRRNWKKTWLKPKVTFKQHSQPSMKPMGFWLLNKLLLMQLIKHWARHKANWLLYETKRSKHLALKWHNVQQLQHVLAQKPAKRVQTKRLPISTHRFKKNKLHCKKRKRSWLPKKKRLKRLRPPFVKQKAKQWKRNRCSTLPKPNWQHLPGWKTLHQRLMKP